MDIKEYPIKELQEELKRREQEENARAITPKTPIDWEPLLKLLQNGVVVVNDEGYVPKDFDHHVFETAMEVVYGRDIFKWWNKMATYRGHR